MNAHDLLVGNGLQPQRIGSAQIGFFRKGQLLEIGLRLDIAQIDALEFFRIEGRAVLQCAELLFQQGELLVGELHRFPFPLLMRRDDTRRMTYLQILLDIFPRRSLCI